MKTFASLLLAALLSTSVMACDRVDAAKVQLALSETGTEWSEQNDRVSVEWGWAWDGAAQPQRIGLLRAFATGDTCLTGRAREIVFYRKGQLVGTASSATGVQLAGEIATVQASTRLTTSAQNLAGCAN